MVDPREALEALANWPKGKRVGVKALRAIATEALGGPDVIDRLNLRTFPPVAPLRDLPEKYSQTQMRLHNDCPRASYLYTKYYGGVARHNMDFGSLVHRFAQLATNQMIVNNESRMDYDTGKDLMEWVIRRSTDLVVPIGLHDEARWCAFHWCEGMVIPPEHVAGVEVMLELDVPLEDGQTRTIRGKADLVLIEGGLCTVWDYKTMFIPAAAKYEDGDLSGAVQHFLKTYQTRFYACCAARGRQESAPFPIAAGCSHFALGELYPRHLWDDGIGTLGPVIFTREQLNEEFASLTAQTQQLEERFQTWDFPARSGHHCGQCPSPKECPIPPMLKDADLGEPTNDEEAALYAERQFHGEGPPKEDRKVLKRYFNTHGPIRFGKDLIWEAVDQNQTETDWEGLERAVEGAVERGEPFRMADYRTTSTHIRFKRRRLTEGELRIERGEEEPEPQRPPGWEPAEEASIEDLDSKYGREAPF